VGAGSAAAGGFTSTNLPGGYVGYVHTNAYGDVMLRITAFNTGTVILLR
jgi:hypothetical protein